MRSNLAQCIRGGALLPRLMDSQLGLPIYTLESDMGVQSARKAVCSGVGRDPTLCISTGMRLSSGPTISHGHTMGRNPPPFTYHFH
jgi:hypothetical protein